MIAVFRGRTKRDSLAAARRAAMGTPGAVVAVHPAGQAAALLPELLPELDQLTADPAGTWRVVRPDGHAAPFRGELISLGRDAQETLWDPSPRGQLQRVGTVIAVDYRSARSGQVKAYRHIFRNALGAGIYGRRGRVVIAHPRIKIGRGGIED